MTKLIAVVAADGRGTQSLLAAEALRKAAAAAGASLTVESRTGGTSSAPLAEAAIAEADAVLIVGDGDAGVARFAGKASATVSLEAALADPAGAITGLLGKPAAAPAPAAPSAARRIVAVTSCPTGIAHTFMAAEGIENAAKALGHAVRVETQGSVGAQNALTAAEIAAADLVVIAADTNVDLSRFAGKAVYSTSTKAAINDGKALIAKAFAEATVQRAAAGELIDRVAAEKAARATERTGPYKHLMTGVSYMLPFVVAGGLLIAIAFALGGIYAGNKENAGTLAHALMQIGGGSGAFGLMVPVLAGFIAYSIADRPGIAPGMIGGMLAGTIGAGFLGGIVAGFLAGYTVKFLNDNIHLGRNLDGLKPVLILPLLGTAIVGLLMVYVIGTPVAAALSALTGWLKGMQTANAVVLGAIIGAMMAFDMGGPVNKAAYAFSTGLIASADNAVYGPMAAAMVAGMTPPLALALATKLFADRFTHDEREAGNAAFVLGISFITEGAIPFAAKDPFRVIPALMVGSAIAGMISMGVGAELKVPHGGIFVLPIPNAVTHLGGYLVAMVAGTIVSAVLLRILKPKVVEA
ncbi:PTS fructose transporter subunit IIC [Pinisolibacter aquiterrae]|uniref:PTS fructose transporter subunit IIC n=1 Tax=Pinisolibacter aquiterrae TaxID=2815579 RepID=UPI001C3C63A5|nr:fructose-specific PTS transporter subunit EIIC [Pinisolibacter aquiterrae]MBV5266574.1 PTS transporter subunit EIIC [Pinisolibacter aquiterrae]MCC8234653.1 fructose-specific PTS transporter subunit EIIC [Pinisolibacter aquiterrae]